MGSHIRYYPQNDNILIVLMHSVIPIARQSGGPLKGGELQAG